MNVNNISSVKGFRCQGISAGLKRSGKKDLALIISDVPGVISVTYTKNIVIAEPLKLNKLNLADGVAQAVVVNSGNANACTGVQGYEGAKAMSETVAAEFQIKPEDVVVFSTGVIGREFPTLDVVNGIKKISKSVGNKPEHGENAARAILTTDTATKQYFSEFFVGTEKVNLAAIAKGSGMIHPNMGTMLAMIICDINIEQSILNEVFKEAVNNSFNMISVDGDTSTNDMAFILCNGQAGNNRIQTSTDVGYAQFKLQVEELCVSLAKMIVKDGEGVTKFIEYRVLNAPDLDSARKVIHTISNSSLVKTAMYGKDPNWGRLIASAGRADVTFDPECVDLYYGEIPLLLHGQPQLKNINDAAKYLKNKEIIITLNLNNGSASSVGWGTDLSTEYVIFNSAYTT